MKIQAKRSKLNSTKIVSVYINGSLYDSFVDQVTLTYGRLGQVTSKVTTAEMQAESCISDLNRRFNNVAI